jgi:hypothetical protein
MTFVVSQKERELVLMRMEVVPPDVVFSSGNPMVKFTRDEVMEHIRKGDDIGNEFVQIEMEFLRAIKSGELMKSLTPAVA